MVDLTDCAKRWAFARFILIGALFLQALVVLFPKMPVFAQAFCYILFLGPWTSALRSRVSALGLPQNRWLLLGYQLFVIEACLLLYFKVSTGRYLAPALFALAHFPLVILKEKAGTSAGTAGAK